MHVSAKGMQMAEEKTRYLAHVESKIRQYLKEGWDFNNVLQSAAASCPVPVMWLPYSGLPENISEADILELLERFEDADAMRQKLEKALEYLSFHIPVQRIDREVRHYHTNNRSIEDLPEAAQHLLAELSQVSPQTIGDILVPLFDYGNIPVPRSVKEKMLDRNTRVSVIAMLADEQGIEIPETLEMDIPAAQKDLSEGMARIAGAISRRHTPIIAKGMVPKFRSAVMTIDAHTDIVSFQKHNYDVPVPDDAAYERARVLIEQKTETVESGINHVLACMAARTGQDFSVEHLASAGAHHNKQSPYPTAPRIQEDPEERSAALGFLHQTMVSLPILDRNNRPYHWEAEEICQDEYDPHSAVIPLVQAAAGMVVAGRIQQHIASLCKPVHKDATVQMRREGSGVHIEFPEYVIPVDVSHYTREILEETEQRMQSELSRYGEAGITLHLTPRNVRPDDGEYLQDLVRTYGETPEPTPSRAHRSSHGTGFPKLQTLSVSIEMTLPRKGECMGPVELTEVVREALQRDASGIMKPLSDALQGITTEPDLPPVLAAEPPVREKSVHVFPEQEEREGMYETWNEMLKSGRSMPYEMIEKLVDYKKQLEESQAQEPAKAKKFTPKIEKDRERIISYMDHNFAIAVLDTPQEVNRWLDCAEKTGLPLTKNQKEALFEYAVAREDDDLLDRVDSLSQLPDTRQLTENTPPSRLDKQSSRQK